MRALFMPVLACLLLSGCALPLMSMAAPQMMSGTPACAAGAACPGGIGTEMLKGVGTSIQSLTGLASAQQPVSK